MECLSLIVTSSLSLFWLHSRPMAYKQQTLFLMVTWVNNPTSRQILWQGTSQFLVHELHLLAQLLPGRKGSCSVGIIYENTNITYKGCFFIT